MNLFQWSESNCEAVESNYVIWKNPEFKSRLLWACCSMFLSRLQQVVDLFGSGAV